MCERRKRQREESIFELEVEQRRVVLLEKRQRLTLEAMTVVSGLFSGPDADEGVRTLLAAVARDLLASHTDPAPCAGMSDSSDEDPEDPEYTPGEPDPEAEQEPEPEPSPVYCSAVAGPEYDPASPARAEIPSVMLFFSALANDRPAPRGMLASDLYTSYKQFCLGRRECCDEEDTLIQARNSFGMLVRTVRGVQKQQSPGGTRYTFDWPAIVRHLRGGGVYCKDARLF